MSPPQVACTETAPHSIVAHCSRGRKLKRASLHILLKLGFSKFQVSVIESLNKMRLKFELVRARYIGDLIEEIENFTKGLSVDQIISVSHTYSQHTLEYTAIITYKK